MDLSSGQWRSSGSIEERFALLGRLPGHVCGNGQGFACSLKRRFLRFRSMRVDAIDGEETASAVKKLRTSSQKVGKKVPTGALKQIQEDMTVERATFSSLASSTRATCSRRVSNRECVNFASASSDFSVPSADASTPVSSEAGPSSRPWRGTRRNDSTFPCHFKT